MDQGLLTEIARVALRSEKLLSLGSGPPLGCSSEKGAKDGASKLIGTKAIGANRKEIGNVENFDPDGRCES
jgi:hypothetical protein